MTNYDDMDWDGILGDSNGPAFQKNEERFGPPLDYVAEKSRRSLEELHAVHRSIEALMPGGPSSAAETSGGSQAAASVGPAASTLPGLLAQVKGSFHYGLVAYLALENMLHLANDAGAVERLLALEPEDFRARMQALEDEGSVAG